jgi:DNA adenine methylase
MIASHISPPLKWHGGKHYLAEKIIALMPNHLHYVEPYAGGLSVLLRKPYEGTSEVANDIDGSLSNFWQVLQDGALFAQFNRRLQATPFSESEWECAGADATTDPVAGAVNFFINCRQSLAGRMDGFASLSRTRTRRGMNEQASAWLTSIEGLPMVHDRLKRVVILNRDGLDVIRQQDGPDTLFYLDPPYLAETRATAKVYKFEMSACQHSDLLGFIKKSAGKVMLSGYPSEMYDRELATWSRHEFKLPNQAAGGSAKREMTEVVWCNFKVTVQPESVERSLPLF